MPIPSPFHERTAPLCLSYRWKEWAGHLAVSSYDTTIDREYFAFRQSAGLLDASPLIKYDVRGKDAGAYLSRMSVRPVDNLKVGRSVYTCWTDDRGHVIDDGTIARLDDDHYRVTTGDPELWWLERNRRGYDVTIEDTTKQIAVLALQGPNSRAILQACSDADLGSLGYFGLTQTKLDGHDVLISRTGYTGDLGYEVWIDAPKALPLWDAITSTGKPYGIEPAGLDALDVTRIEAGYLLLGIDYLSAPRCLLASQKSNPYEIGLGWMVRLEREPFIGQAALREAEASGSPWSFVGLDISWPALEELCSRFGVPPALPAHAWRCSIPIYDRHRQIGYATSGTWSPTLKQNLALATIATDHAAVGTEVDIEVTVEHERHTVPATVVDRPFFDPPRRRS